MSTYLHIPGTFAVLEFTDEVSPAYVAQAVQDVRRSSNPVRVIEGSEGAVFVDFSAGPAFLVTTISPPLGTIIISASPTSIRAGQ
jgi:hypothetical protein